MVEFEPHWADKLDLTIDREQYRKLLKRPSRHVKRMQRKQIRKYKDHEEYKQKYYVLKRQRADDIQKKITKGRQPFDLQRFNFDMSTQVNIFVDLLLFKKHLKTKIEDILLTYGFENVFRQTDRSNLVTNLWKKAKKWSCHVCRETNEGENEFCTMCLTRKQSLHSTRQYRPDQFIGPMKALHMVLDAIDELKSHHPPKASIEGSIAPQFIKSSHGIRYCSCDFFILEHYRTYSIIPPRRGENVVQKRRCVVDITSNGNLASGVILINRLTACICKPDKNEILTNFDDVLAALPSLLSKDPKRGGNEEAETKRICSLCYQELKNMDIEKHRKKFKPKMRVIKPKAKRPSSAEKKERIMKYRSAVKLVTTGRGASHNVHNVVSPLRLGVTRTPHWLKKHRKPNNGKTKTNSPSTSGSPEQGKDMLEHLKFNVKDYENSKRKGNEKVHWWEKKAPPKPTTETIEAASRALDILGAEDILSYSSPNLRCKIKGTGSSVTSMQAIVATRQKIILTQEIIKKQKQLLRSRRRKYRSLQTSA